MRPALVIAALTLLAFAIPLLRSRDDAPHQAEPVDVHAEQERGSANPRRAEFLVATPLPEATPAQDAALETAPESVPAPTIAAIEPRALVAGVVRHADGRAAVGAKVRIAKTPAVLPHADALGALRTLACGATVGEATTDSRGRFACDALARTDPVTTFVVAAELHGASAWRDLIVRDGAARDVALVLASSARLLLTVRPAPAGCEVVLSDGRGDERLAHPDRDGRCSFEALEPGRYALAAYDTSLGRRALVEACARGELPFGATIVVLAAGETRDAVLPLAPPALGGIRGIARDRAEPAHAHRVVVRPRDRDDGARCAVAIPAEDGRFGPLALPPGRYRVALSARDPATEPRYGVVHDELELAAQEITVAAGDPLDVELRADSGEVLVLGVPAAATLVARRADGARVVITTRDGTRRLLAPAGEFALELVPSRGEPRGVALRVVPSTLIEFDFAIR